MVVPGRGDQLRIGVDTDDVVTSIVQIAPDELRSNAWVADFRLQDDIADVESPAVFVGIVRYAGLAPRPNVEVVLTIDNVRVVPVPAKLRPLAGARISFDDSAESVNWSAGVSRSSTTIVTAPAPLVTTY